MLRRLSLFALVLGPIACSSGTVSTTPPPAPRLDPVGVYDFAMDFMGQPLLGTFTIRGEEGAYTGDAMADVGGAQLIDIVVDGMTLTFTADSPQGTVGFRLQFTGNEFVGDWDGMGATGTISGSKRES